VVLLYSSAVEEVEASSLEPVLLTLEKDFILNLSVSINTKYCKESPNAAS
jgi:hypothetical protein